MQHFCPDSSCFKTMKQNDSSWFNVFHGVSCPRNKLFHCWFILIQHVSSFFYPADSSCFMLIQPVSSLFLQCEQSCFMLTQPVSSLFHHCFITVSPVQTSLYSTPPLYLLIKYLIVHSTKLLLSSGIIYQNLWELSLTRYLILQPLVNVTPNHSHFLIPNFAVITKHTFLASHTFLLGVTTSISTLTAT